jgi:hypothetical protein
MRPAGLVLPAIVVQTLHLGFDGDNLILEPTDPAFRDRCRLPVRAVELREIASDAFLQLLHALLELGVTEVLVAVC